MYHNENVTSLEQHNKHEHCINISTQLNWVINCIALPRSRCNFGMSLEYLHTWYSGMYQNPIWHTHKVGMVMWGGCEVKIVTWGHFSRQGGGDPIWQARQVGMVMKGGHEVRMPMQGGHEVRMPTWGDIGHARYGPPSEILHSLIFPKFSYAKNTNNCVEYNKVISKIPKSTLSKTGWHPHITYISYFKSTNPRPCFQLPCK